MQKSTFQKLLEEESELKQHNSVFRPETSIALEQSIGVCCPFEDKPDCKHFCCTKGKVKNPLRSLKHTPELMITFTAWKMHTCFCKV